MAQQRFHSQKVTDFKNMVLSKEFLRKQLAAVVNGGMFAAAVAFDFYAFSVQPESFSPFEKTMLALFTAVLAFNVVYFILGLYFYRQQISQEHFRDLITGGWNRYYFEDKLEKEIAAAVRYHYPMTLCVVDLDKFKAYNEANGSKRGDDLLQRFYRFIQKCVRFTDVVARDHEDTFYVLLTHTDLVNAEKVVVRLLSRTSADLSVTFAAGLTAFCAGEKNSDLVLRAKAALEQAQRKGGNRIEKLVKQGRTVEWEVKTK